MPTKLGQNFLVNKSVVDKIIKSANLSSEDLVLEIGPGKGILTEELAKYAGKVLAVEIDGNLAARLDSRFRGNDKVEIINEDILKTDLLILIKNYKLKTKNYKIVANLPYYITSPVIRKFLEAENPPSEMILMVQKEVAERIVASPGKMSILAVSVQYYAQPEVLFYVEKENFDPVPEVDSAVIKIIPFLSLPSLILPSGRGGGLDKDFFRVVRSGFCAKRKTLANNLANSFHLDKKIIEEKFKTTGILPNTRAQELSVDDWKRLAEIL